MPVGVFYPLDGKGGGGKMSSSEEELLVQMVWDFIESGPPEATGSCKASSPAFSLHQHTCLLLEGLLRGGTDAEIELFEKAVKYVQELGGERKRSSVKKRLMMRLRMDGYDASLCRSSWVSTLECPGGDYEYIDIVMEEGHGAPTRLIVDVDFRSQFELARPTLAYAQLSGALPSVFVGKEEKIKKIVPLLCSAAQESLRQSGLHVPPWRRTSYMQSKWLSCCHKVSTIALPDAARVEVKARGGAPPSPSSKVRDMGGAPRRAQGSALTRQFSDLGICC
ncbi:hypothetical protein Taro_018498 [Colocasia esculenta]|uniref:Plant-specific domain TIGR01615 family protein n=1 Tax=Colocasia esculenta TaxID=4460 RepID=A0A843UR62_COLES|nr:hypothetical protein [Colocasia esculenta]